MDLFLLWPFLNFALQFRFIVFLLPTVGVLYDMTPYVSLIIEPIFVFPAFLFLLHPTFLAILITYAFLALQVKF